MVTSDAERAHRVDEILRRLRRRRQAHEPSTDETELERQLRPGIVRRELVGRVLRVR